MKRFFLSIAAVVVLASPAVAEFEDGLIAYTRGDYMTAFQEWYPLAEEGDAVAQNRIASMFLLGRGVAKDFSEAINWFRQSAEQGDAASQFELGMIYKRGVAAGQDYVEAQNWFNMGAVQGDARSQYQLGQLYKNGLGVAPDPVEAYKWFNLAAGAANGREYALANTERKLMERDMSPDQISTAQSLARDWRAAHPVEDMRTMEEESEEE